MTQSFREDFFSAVWWRAKNVSFWDTFLSSLKRGVSSISYCSKTRLRITVSIFVGIFEFCNSSEYGGGWLCLQSNSSPPLPARSTPLSRCRLAGRNFSSDCFVLSKRVQDGVVVG